MGRIQTSEDVEAPQYGNPPASAPPYFNAEENPAIGKPWSTGLFDCHENETNGLKPVSWLEQHILCSNWLNLKPVVAQHQVHAGIKYVISQDHSTVGMVENLDIGHPWSSRLYDIHEHPTNAVMTSFFPCVTFGQITEVLDEGEMTCPLGSFIYLLMMPALCSQWVMGSKYRTKLRSKYGLVEAPYGDIVSHIFCPCCSLCQEFRELQKRNLDPALGWNGILAQRHGRQYQDQVNVPPSTQAMSK